MRDSIIVAIQTMKWSYFATPMPGAVIFALVQQTTVIFLSALIMDGGAIAQVCMYAFAGYWGGTMLLAFRRGAALSHGDIALVRWGYIPACILSFILTYWIWRIRGYTEW